MIKLQLILVDICILDLTEWNIKHITHNLDLWNPKKEFCNNLDNFRTSLTCFFFAKKITVWEITEDKKEKEWKMLGFAFVEKQYFYPFLIYQIKIHSIFYQTFKPNVSCRLFLKKRKPFTWWDEIILSGYLLWRKWYNMNQNTYAL